MKAHKGGMRAFWAAAITIPTIACLIAILQFPPGAIVPTHWGIDGEIDGWNSPWTVLPVGLLMSGINALLAASYRRSDKLHDLGLVHGVSRKRTRPFLAGFAAFMTLVVVVVLVRWVFLAQAAI